MEKLVDIQTEQEMGSWRRRFRRRTAVLVAAIVIALCAVGYDPESPRPAAAREGSGSGMFWATAPSLAGKKFEKPRSALVLALSDLSLEGQFCEDVIAVKLMTSGIDIISREKRDREQLVRLDTLAQDAAGEKGDSERKAATPNARRDPNDRLTDLMAVARAVQGDVIITAVLVTETVQSNMVEVGTSATTGVRTTIRVGAVSVTVIEAKTGRLLLAGYQAYPNAITLIEAATNIGEGIVGQLQRER